MSGDLTRRHLLTLAGASAAAAFGSAGCSSDCADQRPCPPAEAAQVYVSRPDLTPPAVTVARYPGAEDSRLIFLDVPYSGPGHGGTLILDSGGEVTWFGPNSQTERRLNFAVQSYRGNPVLTWFQGLVVQGYGRGELVIADSSYQAQHVIRPVGGELADFHDFVITPEGHALITIYRQHARVDLSAVGGPPSGYLISGVVQEIEIETGKLLFEWDSKDHVPVHETYQELGSGDGGSGTSLQAVISAARLRSAAACAVPLASAARSTRLAVSRTPAKSSSSPAARANGMAAAALSFIADRPGDMDFPATSSSASRGASPCVHRAQWYQARVRVTGPSTVSMTLSR